MTIITKDSIEDEKLQRARAAAWKNMSDPGRQQFLWPEPGLPRPEGEDAALFGKPAPGKDDPVADPFCLCVLDVHEVDLLCLKTNERRSYKRDGETWTESFVNP